MLKGHCYMVHTWIHLNGRLTFFPSSCALNDLCVHWQVLPKPGGKAVIEVKVGKTVIKSIPIASGDPN
jgi:hypothetical protein